MKKFCSRLVVFCACLLAVGVLLGQIRLPKIKIPKDIPGLDDILKSEPPLTTGVQDAVTEVPFLDDYNPECFMPLTMLPRTAEGAFILKRTGDLEFEAESYCLKAGTYAPSGDRGGSGYLHAPQKGPLADVVRSVIRRSYLHPDIPQRDIQVLLWAIIARAKFSSMPRAYQLIAARLLTPQEILRLNGGALGLVPKRLKDQAFEKLPPAARRVLEAEAELRSLLTEAQATYEDLERAAVLTGDPPPDKEDRQVPRGRWSLHPEGYFIRYFPRGYREIRIELSVPAPLEVGRDDRGRVTLIADKDGNRIEAEYDDGVAPTSISGEPSLKGYPFRSIRFAYPDPDEPGKKLSAQWVGTGWTFVGVPSGGGRGGQESGRFSGVADRYLRAQGHRKDLELLTEGFAKVRSRKAQRNPSSSAESMASVMALAHFAEALREVVEGSGTERAGWILNPVNLVKRAWQYEVTIYEGINTEVVADGRDSGLPIRGTGLYGQGGRIGPRLNGLLASVDFAGFPLSLGGPAGAGTWGESSENGAKFDPTDGMAQPGQQGSQRLNQSHRPSEKQKCKDKAREQLEADLEKDWNQYGPGTKPLPWDSDALYKCLVLYPKGKRHLCFRIHMPDLMKMWEKYPFLDGAFLSSGIKWLEAHKKCG
jgi:hypothetical protein